MTDPNPAAPTDHIGLEVLSNAECDSLLAETKIGRIAFVADGDVVIFPVNYRFVDHTIVFRTADGTKLEVAANHQPVAFEIDGYDVEAKSGWSVLVKGIARYVMEDEEEALLADLDLRPWAPLTQVRRWVRISPEEITGRKIV
jgi:nitroimidazol reductase NimA-like FMN-containing flavoprotein (pyridoxamine 5'-phosphate oxidase superfamily)